MPSKKKPVWFDVSNAAVIQIADSDEREIAKIGITTLRSTKGLEWCSLFTSNRVAVKCTDGDKVAVVVVEGRYVEKHDLGSAEALVEHCRARLETRMEQLRRG